MAHPLRGSSGCSEGGRGSGGSRIFMMWVEAELSNLSPGLGRQVEKDRKSLCLRV